ncbi:MAG: molybdopterin-guanine dinucleotide biosynthesis protein B [Bilifractor porci]|jgi:molybdopterin-guanine dinucleotide biosynthesis protein MobB
MKGNAAEKKNPVPEQQIVVRICGIKNSGKTTLIVSLIRILTGRGLRVAVLKHDGHDFTCDVPGTDSYRFDRAGAYGTAVLSASQCFIHKRTAGESMGNLAAQFPDADVILIEGMKEEPGKKVEVIRGCISREPASNPEGRFLIVTDLPAEQFSEPVLGFGDTEKIADRILETGRKSVTGKKI